MANYEEKNSINWDEDIIVPTHEIIRNNEVEEKGRGRKRNRNDIYKNTTLGLVMGCVGEKDLDGQSEMYKFLYEKDIEDKLEELKLEGIKVPSKSRIIKDFKQIHDQLGARYIDIINTQSNGLCYVIKQSYEGKYFVAIPLYKWKELNLCTNKEMLRLFTVISMHEKISTTNSVIMTRAYLCKCMDINPTPANQNYIGTMTNALFKLGLVDIETEDRIEYDEAREQRVSKTYNWFRLTTKEEWEEKSKKKKKKRK